MASRANLRRGSIALGLGASLALLLVVICACGENGGGAVSDGQDGGPTSEVEDGTTADATVDRCARVLVPSPDCEHPEVSASCMDGWCRIPKGCFIIGAPPCEFGRGLYAENQIQVTLTHDFEMQRTELTQAEWVKLGFENPSAQIDAGANPGEPAYGDCLEPSCPVGNITLEDAMSGANVLSQRAGLPECYALSQCRNSVGKGLSCERIEATTESLYDCRGYRLPTEAEWEYAARAGTTTSVFTGELTATARIMDCIDDPVLRTIAWYCANSGNYTHPVGGKQANGWGLVDMHGNAYEWTTSQYTGAGYGPSPQVDPMSKLGTRMFIFRGGTVHSPAVILRSASRSRYSNHGTRGPLIGVRYVRSVELAR